MVSSLLSGNDIGSEGLETMGMTFLGNRLHF
jgi:hypothetical protein